MKHQMRWTVQKIGQRLELIAPLVYRQRHPIAPFRFMALSDPLNLPLDLPPISPEVDDSDWPVIEPDTYWAGRLTNFVLRSSFEIPADWPADAMIGVHLSIGDGGDFSHPEALAYIDGAAYATCDRHHREFRLKPEWRDGRSHALALHGWTGMGGSAGSKLMMRASSVVLIDQPTRNFVVTARVALETIRVLSENVPARGKLLNALDAAFLLLETREPFGEAFYASVPEALRVLREQIAEAGAPLDAEVTGTGHAHIDVAWLWALGQTRRKAGRTFHTVTRLMEQFPDYHFTQSQPQLYEYIRQDYPELFEAIKQRVAEGRWEPIGGMWVEADCNLSGAESLARQFLLGRSFFEQHFGSQAESPVLWLPDVFGYAWALPQLIKQAGLEYFFTIKIGWSQYNHLPYDSFWWQGLDGTRVLTHFSTTREAGSSYASTYNAMATPEQIHNTWTNFKQKDLAEGQETPPLLMAFGFGDGGGGPTREMLENLEVMRSFPGLPRTKQGSVREFFQQLEETSGAQLPTWNGELYLEYHRGTYTTQSRNKRANRKSEFLLHDAEFLAALAAQLDAQYRYPATTLRTAWELVCLNQFHDIIPGSSIHSVYVESQQQYTQIREMAVSVRESALQAIAEHVGGDVLIVNPTSFGRNDLAFWPGQVPVGQTLQDVRTGEPVYSQSASDGTWIAAGTLSPFAVNALAFQPGVLASPETAMSVSATLLENRYLRVELNTAGDITRIYDKFAQREVLPEGELANQFLAFEDRPMAWDAWDVDIFYDDKHWTAEPATSVRVVAEGPLRVTLEIERRILHSSYTQRISLSYNSPRLDIETSIEWIERHILLKVAFPVDILSPVATYEIQWGNVQRPTHHNTSWDWARFETCAQKWVDLSEGDYGVSLLNDCKYGHDIHENSMRISLLRSPTYPDEEADQGTHHFTYSLLPHSGSWGEATIEAAYSINDAVIAHTVEARPGQQGALASRQIAPLIVADRANVVIETIKRAEDGNGIIVRLYESQRRRGPVSLRPGFALASAWRTNLLEQDEVELPLADGQFALTLHPYEIVTLRLIPA